MIVGALLAKLGVDAIFHHPTSWHPRWSWLIWVGFFAMILIPAIVKALSRDSERRAEQLADEALAGGVSPTPPSAGETERTRL
jgi:hypothetical protein